jgi:glyoxylase-like metal-dependent hydrolase (beta-lactamase superfamily II)
MVLQEEFNIMDKIYGIFQGVREMDYAEILPNVFECSTPGLIYYPFWCLKGENSTILVDTGLNNRTANLLFNKKFFGGEEYILDKLKALDVDPASIKTVIVSHLHLDHFSAYHLYPNATFYIQRKDIEFFSGPASHFRQIYIPATDMSELMKLAYSNRIKYLDGDAQIVPGIRVVLIGGHTPGNQVIVVSTKKGDVVLCCDAMHFFRNMEEESIGVTTNLLDALLGLEKIKTLTTSPELLVAGHDPCLLDRFPSPIENVIEIA